MAEEQEVAIDGPQASDHPVGAGAYGRDRLTAWTAVAK